MKDWNAEYTIALAELREAKAIWKFADDALARANAQLTKAQERAHQLFEERVRQVESTLPTA